MTGHSHSLSVWKLFAFTAVLLLCSGQFNSAFSQANPYFLEAHYSAPERTTNPPVNRIIRRIDKDQIALEISIKQGNQARDIHDYPQALHYYQRAQQLKPQEPRGYYGLGNIYIDLYCADSAIANYLKALSLKKDYVEAMLALGYAYSGKERFDEAEAQFQAALRLQPKSVGAVIGLGFIESNRNKYADAIKRINQILDSRSLKDTDRAWVHLVLGEIYNKQGKQQEAITQFKKAIEQNPNLGRCYLELGATQLTVAFAKLANVAAGNIAAVSVEEKAKMRAVAREATDNLERAKEHNFNHPVLYEILGMALAYQFRFQDASAQIDTYFAKVEELKTQFANVPTKCDVGFNQLNAIGNYYRGYISSIEGDFETDTQRKAALYDEAIKQFQQVIAQKQDYVAGYLMMGICYDKRGKPEEAISQYKNVILYSADEGVKANNYQSVGLVYAKIGRDTTAIESIQKAIKLNPNDPSYYESLASIYIKQSKLEETLAALKKATELRKEPPTNPLPYFYLGVTYGIRYMKEKHTEDYDNALIWLKKAIEIKPDDAFAYSAMGAVYKKHSDADSALAAYQKAAEYDEKNPDHYYGIADVYANLKKNDDAAIKYLEKAIEVSPNYAKGYQFLGTIYHRRNLTDEAIKKLQKAITVDPKFLSGYYDLAIDYKEQGNYAEALKVLSRTTELAPTDFQPYKEIAKVYEEQGKNEDAIRYYQEAINRVDANNASAKELYLCRIERLRGHYADAITCFQKMNFPDDPNQSIFEIGIIHIVNKNKSAALEQHQKLAQQKSPLAEELIKKINEMK